MTSVHTLIHAGEGAAGPMLFVGVMTDSPAVVQEWAARLREMVGAKGRPSEGRPSNVNPTVRDVVRAALDEGAPLDRARYGAFFDALVGVTEAGDTDVIAMADLAGRLKVKSGTVKAMNTKLSARIRRVLERREAELRDAVPPLPVLQRNLDALLHVRWDRGNPSYRLTPSALPAVQDWLASR